MEEEDGMLVAEEEEDGGDEYAAWIDSVEGRPGSDGCNVPERLKGWYSFSASDSSYSSFETALAIQSMGSSEISSDSSGIVGRALGLERRRGEPCSQELGGI